MTAAHACSSPSLSSRAASRVRDTMGWLRTLLWLTPGVALRWLCETGSIFWSSCESRGEGGKGE